MKYIAMAIKLICAAGIALIAAYCLIVALYAEAMEQVEDQMPNEDIVAVEQEQKEAPAEQKAEEVVPLPSPVPATDFPEDDLIALAQTAYGEAGCCSMTEQAAVIWCILNRVDSEDFPNTIQEVVKQPGHFVGYDPNHPVDPVLVELARDVLNRWENNLEGRVLPKEYLFFHGDGKTNYFRTEFRGAEGYWDWSLESPYGGC